uniref:Lysine-specific demethylase 6A n=1 Tax=Magallana gigas TaxID=29159 RepID=A0A8W8J020_MAGGI
MNLETTEVSLTAEEKKQLEEYDSCQFGFLKLNVPEEAPKRALIEKGIKYFEHEIIQKSKRDGAKEGEEIDASVDPKIYCQLGHLLLLLEQYPKALSAYQRFFHLREDHWKNAPFMYGLGLVYFHFNAFQICNFLKPGGVSFYSSQDSCRLSQCVHLLCSLYCKYQLQDPGLSTMATMFGFFMENHLKEIIVSKSH